MLALDAFRDACRTGDVTYIRRALTLSGADLLSQDQQYHPESSSLWVCAERGHVDALAALVRAGWSVSGEAPSRTGQTSCVSPLYVAAQNGHIEAVDALLEYGATVDAERSSSGATALYVACQQGHADVVRRLLAAGASVDHSTRDGITPLMVAAHQGHLACVVQLLRGGADPSRQALGRTVRQWAVAGGHAAELDTALRRAAQYQSQRTRVPSRGTQRAHNRPRIVPSPSALMADAADLEQALGTDNTVYASRLAHLHEEMHKCQRGEASVFSVDSIQEVEQIQAAWEGYKRRLQQQLAARKSAAGTVASLT